MHPGNEETGSVFLIPKALDQKCLGLQAVLDSDLSALSYSRAGLELANAPGVLRLSL